MKRTIEEYELSWRRHDYSPHYSREGFLDEVRSYYTMDTLLRRVKETGEAVADDFGCWLYVELVHRAGTYGFDCLDYAIRYEGLLDEDVCEYFAQRIDEIPGNNPGEKEQLLLFIARTSSNYLTICAATEALGSLYCDNMRERKAKLRETSHSS